MNQTPMQKTLLNADNSTPKKYSEAGNTVALYTARVIWKKSYAVANGKKPTVTWRCDLTAEEYPKLITPVSHELYPLWIKFQMYEHNIYQIQFYDNAKPSGFKNQCIYHQRVGLPPVVNLLSEYMELTTGNSWKKLVHQTLK